jgi:hypothetical protein
MVIMYIPILEYWYHNINIFELKKRRDSLLAIRIAYQRHSVLRQGISLSACEVAA